MNIESYAVNMLNFDCEHIELIEKILTKIYSTFNKTKKKKTNDNFVFSIHKSNSKPQIFRFLKIFDGFLRSSDETEFLNYLIDSTVSEGMKEFREMKAQQG